MSTLLQTIAFDADLIRKYDRPLPRYTSYPPATELKETFDGEAFRRSITASNQRGTPLSLYFHIPFCQSACYFCGCNVIVSGNKRIAQPYVECLIREIQQTSKLIDTSRPVIQLHWGGGTPNYLELDQVESLWETIRRHFNLASNAEVSIEVNPRYIDRNDILALRDLGFNRISFGIQDFNPLVQAAVNRVQSEELLFNMMDWVRDARFESVNVDLIYGLPHQTLNTFEDTIRKTIALNPDRIAVFNFAFVPWLKPVQSNISQDTLPSPQEKLDILKMTIEELTRHHYQYIGMDHFAKPEDELAIAQQQGTLKRNFQGYTTQPDAELFGFGLTSISMLHDTYAQHHKTLKDYYEAIAAEQLPIERGVALSQDDIIRRSVIMELMCQFELPKAAIEQIYQLDFDTYFQTELIDLQLLEADGLLRLWKDRIEVSPVGRLLIRNIVSVFDAHLRDKITAGFSKSI
ncbi:MAG: oxygen-independent coproporphyrinogen III oxidase [Leptolyngbyaceae cyanobacterium bins.59]|nr:oxygen-independent coproporphyrinogen III oxidase [Leptolyngbyaceae cyanobacterium bins.59]